MKPDPKLEMIGHNVVIDNGTYTVKGGFSEMDSPSCRVPSLVGRGRHAGAMSSLGLKETYVGAAAQSLRGILSMSHPVRQGAVQSWDDLEAIWSYMLETELKTEAGAQPVIMTQPPVASQQEEDTMAQILVEKLGVPAFFIANKSVMSLYGGGQMTGIAVDSGHDTTYIVPTYQGNPVQEATLVLRLGGRHVTEQLMHQLLNGKYSFPDDNFMLWRKKKKTNFTVSSRKDIVREMKVQREGLLGFVRISCVLHPARLRSSTAP
jgi:actin-related protein